MIKLNLGCGWRNFGEDWIHVDGGNYPHVKHHDITKLIFKENTVDLIYASHVFEYFDRQEGAKVLKEWYRVLKPNSLLRIAVPDFEMISKLYASGKFPLSKLLGPLYGRMEMGMNGGETGQTIYHKTTYDFEDLKKTLTEAGFRNIVKYDWRTTSPHDHIDDHSQAYLPCEDFVPTKEKPFDKERGYLMSLNVECNK